MKAVNFGKLNNMTSKDYTQMLRALDAIDAIIEPNKNLIDEDVPKTRVELERFRGFLLKQKRKYDRLERPGGP
jgi:hypothetical protein